MLPLGNVLSPLPLGIVIVQNSSFGGSQGMADGDMKEENQRDNKMR